MKTDRSFRDLHDFVARAEPGEAFTKHSDRFITTFVMHRRISETIADLDHVETTHWGKDAPYSAPAKSYEGTAMIHRVQMTEIGHSTSYNRDDTGLGRLLVEPSLRFNATKLHQVHQRTLAMYRAATTAA